MGSVQPEICQSIQIQIEKPIAEYSPDSFNFGGIHGDHFKEAEQPSGLHMTHSLFFRPCNNFYKNLVVQEMSNSMITTSFISTVQIRSSSSAH